MKFSVRILWKGHRGGGNENLTVAQFHSIWIFYFKYNQRRRKMLEVRKAVNVTARRACAKNFRPCPFCVLYAVGQEFVGCSYEKTNSKSSGVCFTATYS